MRPRSGDIRVIGLVAGTHVIEDIGRDVPHGVTVTIPGELALQSKDLWRAISQKCLFQLPTAAPPPHMSTPVFTDSDKAVLEAQIRELETQVRVLEAENRALKELAQTTASSDKLDAILMAIQSGQMSMGAATGGVRPAARPSQEVADGTAPTFLPSEIRPRDVDARIEERKETQVSDVSSAAGRLRKLRKGADPNE